MSGRRMVSGVLVAVLLGFVVFCLAWRVGGGRWERVESPSMGTVAPVGTLLWVRPAPFDRLQPGDFITFHPPGSGATYSHRVYHRHADGTISTKGVIPGPDPWRLHAADVVGQVRMRWWGVGWIVAAAPVLLIGGIGIALVRTLVRREWSTPVMVLLGAVVLTAAIVWCRPFVNAEQVAFAPSASGGADATYVGTGLLPIRLQAHHGGHVDLHDGEVGTVHVDGVDPDGRFRVSLRPAIPLWWWIPPVLACFAPALWALVIGDRRISDHALDRGPRSPGRRARARGRSERPRRGGLRSAPTHRARPV